MNIFALQTNVVFQTKPEWLDSFLKKYNDVVFDYHVTLKQPCIILEEEISEVTDKLQKYFTASSINPIPIVFDKLVVDPDGVETGKACIMINATMNEQIHNLQKSILEMLNRYRNYVSADTEQYENNFIPHITIAADLDETKLNLAKNDLEEDYYAEGVISEVILIVVRNFNPKNIKSGSREDIVFKLG